MIRLDRKHILVVDDDPSIAESLKDLLESEGYYVETAANGREALDLLRARQRPNLILLDLTMPVMGGADFRRQQLLDAALSAIPVVVVSADADQQAEALEPAAWFRKPLNVEEIIPIVRNLVSTCISTRH